MTGALYCVMTIVAVSVPGVAWSPAAQAARHRSPPPVKVELSSKTESLLHEAEDALTRHDYAAAEKALKAVVKLQPDMGAAWFNLGYAYTGLHQDDDAVQAYRKTLELQPDLFEARLNLGVLLVEMKRPQDSLEHLEKAAGLKPENARAHLYCGRALAAVGQADAAEKQFLTTARLEPTLAIVHFDLGQLKLAQKKFEEARAAFGKASSLDQQLAQAELGEALALEGLARSADATSHFERYLELKPGDLETRFHLARIDLQAGKNQQALDNLQFVYQKKPDIAGLTAALGDVYALLKKFPESEKYYRQALVAMPGEPDLHRALGQTLLDQQKFGEAETEFHAALIVNPQNADAIRGLSSSLYLQKRYAETIPLLEAQARAPDARAMVFFVLATCYDHLHVNLKAIEAYERFVELSHSENPDQEWQARQRIKLLRRVAEK
jgi:tetratricopeptide (TPR) repeat protein